MRRVLVAAAIAAPFLMGALSASAADRDVVFRFQDPAILESSALIATGDLMVTTNDSGDSARVFTVDPDTGATLGTISWGGAAADVEAMAPARGGQVWVADIGDNLGKRHDISVTRIPVGPADATVSGTTYPLEFRDGPRDAEALLAHPTTGRLYVVSKGVLGGQFYVAPKTLRTAAPNRLTTLGAAPGLVTDGAFFPDGKHLVVRTYSRAVVYRFPSLEVVGTVDLPRQQQGEGIAVAPDGRIYLSSEGVHAEVLRITLPKKIQQAMSTEPSESPTATPSEASSPGETAESQDQGETDDPEVFPWVIGGLVGVVMLIVLVRSLRPR
ncbi:esterase-like activity of phytase family protein [Nocardioides sp. JQ2195]|uniref:esterase-like activity of phytase family protein n=1 Tax=Nocardioides sp. JQ2195 TaxID=2592334 RepID=UPI00143E52A9|nr:esterase-like activity of phytase family protein [Nocardioides sp. JQ2195]QIX28042.1 esterase-like activity of phytase family protein [Nocardioides sp. JQ2195]